MTLLVEQLFRLQLIDKRLKEIENAQQDRSDLKKLVEAKKREQILNDKINQLDWQLRGLKHRLTQGEADLSSLDQKIREYQSKLYDGQTRNIKELEGLEAKVENLLSLKNQLEKSLIELMQEVETQEHELNSIQADFNRLKSDVLEMEKIYKVKLQKLHAEEKSLHAKRSSLILTVPPAAYEHYLKMYRQHGGLAVVKVKNHACSGCMVTLSPALMVKVKTSEELVHCEFCGRILFYHVMDEIEKSRKH